MARIVLIIEDLPDCDDGFCTRWEGLNENPATQTLAQEFAQNLHFTASELKKLMGIEEQEKPTEKGNYH